MCHVSRFVSSEIGQKCMPLSPPLNGNLNTLDTEVGVTVTFTCKPGYLMDGDEKTECRRGGHWSSIVPKCVPGWFYFRWKLSYNVWTESHSRFYKDIKLHENNLRSY